MTTDGEELREHRRERTRLKAAAKGAASPMSTKALQSAPLQPLAAMAFISTPSPAQMIRADLARWAAKAQQPHPTDSTTTNDPNDDEDQYT